MNFLLLDLTTKIEPVVSLEVNCDFINFDILKNICIN
jgi:hypothetical protein